MSHVNMPRNGSRRLRSSTVSLVSRINSCRAAAPQSLSAAAHSLVHFVHMEAPPVPAPVPQG